MLLFQNKLNNYVTIHGFVRQLESKTPFQHISELWNCHRQKMLTIPGRGKTEMNRSSLCTASEIVCEALYTVNWTLRSPAHLDEAIKGVVTQNPKPPTPMHDQDRNTGLPWWRSGWESACQCRGHGFEPWSGRIPHAAEQLGPWATTTEPERLEPASHNYWACASGACAPQQERLR